MTPSTRPVTRLSSAWVRDRGMRQVVVTITGSLIELRLKGCRQSETVDIGSLWYQSVKARVIRDRLAKKAAKKPAKKAAKKAAKAAGIDMDALKLIEKMAELDTDDAALAEAEIRRSDQANAARMHEQFGVHCRASQAITERMRLFSFGDGMLVL